MGIYLHGKSSIWCKHGNSFLCLLIIISGTLNLKRKREENNNKNINNCQHFHSYCQLQKRFFSSPLLTFSIPICHISSVTKSWKILILVTVRTSQSSYYIQDFYSILVLLHFLFYIFYSPSAHLEFQEFFVFRCNLTSKLKKQKIQ